MECIELCFENARKLSRDAKSLMEGNGSPSSAFVLYSLSVEEFGKGLLYEEQLSSESSDVLDVELHEADHNRKYKKGFQQMGMAGTKIDSLLTVTANNSKATQTFKNPFRGDAAVSVPPFATGKFADSTVHKKMELGKVKPDKDLRFAIAYVGWDESNRRWKNAPQWNLSREDVEALLRVLDQQLAKKPKQAMR